MKSVEELGGILMYVLPQDTDLKLNVYLKSVQAEKTQPLSGNQLENVNLTIYRICPQFFSFFI